ncbi:serine/threonine-protein kinase [Planktothrix paucivesiculata]|uniref:Serine/threonine protein kinase with WD-40 repeats n=1 Tax=Planktothrix paucivesiculata PCC 9631 TaxID=671071 RepID=A0A7Z9BK45_9CYAN|nr:serine/threonine-protein kinase [Planktothrix paucivesiculata]VXD15741.1 Serine/threonine protein kinase with WD-40 repeats [Planktothrix paucivesiculata PCC 9631]
MSYCLNSYCRNPQNPSGITVCQTCGTTLLLKERYRPVEELGGGGMSRTFLGVDLDRLNTPCIIKQFLPPSHKISLVKQAIEHFNQEALRLQELGIHTQIPALYAYFEQEQHLYLIEEWVEGKNLLQELNETGAFSENKIIQLLEDILLILQFIHQHHIIHRDIKPDNIIRRKTDQKLVLVDFGIAKYSLNLGQPQTGTLTGTIGYAPLEQMRGGKAYPASDLYSLGMTCIHLLTQILPNQLFDPFTGELIWRSHLKNINKTLSKKLTRILDKLLKDLVKERYQTVEEVLQDLAAKPLIPPVVNIPIPPPSPLNIIIATELQAVTSNLFSQNYLFFKANSIPLLSHNSLLWEHSSSSSATVNSPFLESKFISKTQLKPLLPDISLDCINTLSGHKDTVKALAISPNGYILVSGSQDKTLIIWNLKTGQLLYRLIGHEAAITSVAISPNGHKLVSGSLDRTLISWNLDKRAIADRFFSHSGSPYSHRCGAVYSVDYSPDGDMIASGSEDKSIKLWNQRNGELVYRYSEHLDAVLSVKFIDNLVNNPCLSPSKNSYYNHGLFVSSSKDGTIKIWQLSRLKSLQTLTGHSDQVCAIVVSPTQPLLISGSADHTVKLWNLNTGELIKTLTEHSDRVSSVAISPDGQWLASSSDDGIIYLWDMGQPQNLGILSGRLEGCAPIIFSPDHQHLICCDKDDQILVWQFKIFSENRQFF